MNHVGTITLETERLILRRHEYSDAEDMFRNWAADPQVSRFWGWKPHTDISETKELLAGWIKGYEKPDVYHWIIVLKENRQAIGYIYLKIEDENDPGNSVSVHYALGRAYWGRGIMTEACGQVIDFAFTVLGAKRIQSYHHVDNPASGRVMEKCGMRYVKTRHRHIPDCEDISGDYAYYEIAASEWPHIAIRLAKPADAPDMAEVLMRSWEAAYKDIFPAEYIREKNAARPERFRRWITDDNDDSYVIQYRGKTAGIMKIAPPLDEDMDDNACELHYIYLHPGCFRMGIGSKAMDFAFRKARALGKTLMTVWVLAQNVNSIRFYRKCGFAEDGAGKSYSYVPGVDLIRMRKKLHGEAPG